MASAAEEAEAKRVREEGWRAAARQRCALLVFFSISPSRETTGRHSPGAPEEREIEGRSKQARCNAFPNSHSTSGLRRSFRLLQLAERAETSERRRRRRRSMSAAPRSTKRERDGDVEERRSTKRAKERAEERGKRFFLLTLEADRVKSILPGVPLIAAAALLFSFAEEAIQDSHNFDTFAKGRNKGWDRERCLRCSPLTRRMERRSERALEAAA